MTKTTPTSTSLEILKFPHPALLTPAEPVTEFGEELAAQLDEMFAVMQANKGMGLAANQVGISKRMFVMEGPSGEKHFLVNPLIFSRSGNNISLSEGCLSAPGDFVKIFTRVDAVLVKYQDEKGEAKELMFTGIHSVCVQHEIEHLEGKAFIQSPSLPSKKRKFLMKKWGLK